MNITLQNSSILNEFMKILGNKIVPDGIVNPDQWAETNPKIVFVLKETNEQETSLTDLLNDPFSGRYRTEIEEKDKRNGQIVRDLRTTWLNIARWARGIIDNTTIPWEEIDHESNWYKNGYIDGQQSGWLKELKKIAVINIKKTPGKAESNENELNKAVELYGGLTWKQINYYNPKIVIFCGVSSIFDTYFLKVNKIIDWLKTKTGYWYFMVKDKDTVFIQFWHPNAHFPHNMMYYTLMDIVKELHAKYKIW